MPEQSIIHPRLCRIQTQAVGDVIESGRRLFSALSHCSFTEEDTRPGIQMSLTRRMTVFNRWTVDLPDKHVLVTKEMMGI